MKKFFSQKKKLFSLAILAGALLWSGILVFGAPQNSSTKPVVAVQENNASNQLPTLDFISNPVFNFTNEFEDRALQKLIADNQSLVNKGVKDSKQMELLPSGTDVEKIISDIIDSDIIQEKVSPNDILVNSDNSKNTQLAYLLFIDQILRTSPASSTQPKNNELTDYFAQTSAYYGHIADLLLVINVPPSWTDIHKSLVEFFLRQKNIFRSLSLAQTDPLRFMVALNRVWPDEISKEFTAIQSQINQKIKDEKLI